MRDTHRVGLALTRLLSHGRYYYCLPREEGAEAQHHPASKRWKQSPLQVCRAPCGCPRQTGASGRQSLSLSSFQGFLSG